MKTQLAYDKAAFIKNAVLFLILDLKFFFSPLPPHHFFFFLYNGMELGLGKEAGNAVLTYT